MAERVEFVYKFSDDYNPLYVNGAHGGMNHQKEVEINFYHERTSLPYKKIIQYDEESGDLIKESSDEESLKVVRFIQTGVVMSRTTAESLYKWLEVVLSDDIED